MSMTVYDLISMNRSNMRVLQEYDIKMEDVIYIEVYEEYLRMKRVPGLKTSYIVAVLAENHRISEARVWRVIQKFRKPITGCV